MIPKRIGKTKTSRTYLYNLAWYWKKALHGVIITTPFFLYNRVEV